jgi:type II secretory pathway predicted ATPase ExeA
LVVLDEAHLLTQAMLEQLRLLFSDKMDSQSLATLALVGHPDLRRTLHLSVHEAFTQRLAVRYHLGPLDLQEPIGYIKHQVRIAGYTAGPLERCFLQDRFANLSYDFLTRVIAYGLLDAQVVTHSFACECSTLDCQRQ